MASGSRIVVFRVAGIIQIDDRISISKPYITIAGQTAPGGGILVKGNEISITTHDVIVRFIRVRTGRRDEFGYQSGDAIGLGSSCHKVMIDHCSASWSNDENMQIWSSTNASHNVTFSWNMIAEGLTYNHASCGLIVGSDYDAFGIHDISVHHNAFMHGNNRFPLVKCRDARIINNLMYNWDWWPTGTAGGIKVDIIGNKYKMGPSTPVSGYSSYEVWVRDRGWQSPDDGCQGLASIYIRGNIGPHQDDPNGDNWGMLLETDRVHTPLGYPPDRATHERFEPMTGSTHPITVHPVSDLENMILADVGASRRLDENGNWVSNRDAVDERLINEYINGTGQIPNDENAVGGYPTIDPGTPYQDWDHDGMPDQWENQHGLEPGDDSDGPKDADGDGYTNIEEFLNGTDPHTKNNG